MYLIVVGAGNIGTPLIELATSEKNEVVVIERDEERAERAASRYDCLVLNDNATVHGTLEDAGASRADAIISTTDDDATNIMVLLLAKELEIPSLVSVVHNEEHMNVFRQIGANIIGNPQRLIAEYLYRAVRRPSVKDFMHLGETAEVFEITIVGGAPIDGKTLREADESGLLPDDSLVVAIERNGSVLTPRGNTEIHRGDLVTMFSKQGITDKIIRTFTG